MQPEGIQETVRRTKAVVFDLFHTLTAIESSWGQGLPFTYEMLGVDRDAWDKQLNRYSCARLAGEEQDSTRIVGRMAREINPDITDDTIQSAVTNRIKRFEAALLDIPIETRAVLKTLKSQKKKLGLISNADTMEVAAWGRSPIAGIFDVEIFSCHVGAVKPEKEIYELCLSRLGVSSDEAIFVGDGGSSELQGARAVGLTTVMITGVIKELWPERIEERKTDADFVIEQLTELVADEDD